MSDACRSVSADSGSVHHFAASGRLKSVLHSLSILSITFILMDTVGTVVFAESNATQQKAQALIADAPIDLSALLKDPWGVISTLLLDALFGSWKELAAQNATLLG